MDISCVIEVYSANDPMLNVNEMSTDVTEKPSTAVDVWAVENDNEVVDDLASTDNTAESSGNKAPVLKSCTTCEYHTYSSGNLSRHKKSVHLEKRFDCSNCNKTFTSKHYLSQHNRTVHKNIQFMCEMCPKKVNSRQALHRHKKIMHSESPNYVCNFCGRNFHEKSHFQGHVNKHIDNKAYICPNCQKPYHFKQNMMRHAKSCDKNVKNYHCEECDKHFSTNEAYNDHCQGMHGPKNKICLCGKKNAWRSAFSRHLKKCKYSK